MITIDDLIAEGKNFKIETSPLHETFESGFRVIHEPTSYIKNGDEYMAWIEKSKRFISVNYPKDRAVDDFVSISKEFKNDTLFRLVAILVSLKAIPNICPAKSELTEPKTIVNVSQNQHQRQTIMVDIFIEAIKDELTGSQLKEIRQIIEKEKDPQMAKPKIIEKIKTFGDTVLTNVIANIITNPAIWGNF